MKGALIRSAIAVTFACMLVAAAGAFAAVRLAGGALYTGKSPDCGSSVPGTTCQFRFRASGNGRSLRFVGRTVIDTWGCRGGGGEALLGGKLKNETPTPIPVVTWEQAERCTAASATRSGPRWPRPRTTRAPSPVVSPKLATRR